MGLCVVCLFPSVLVAALSSFSMFVCFCDVLHFVCRFVSFFRRPYFLSQGFFTSPSAALFSITILACLSELRG